MQSYTEIPLQWQYNISKYLACYSENDSSLLDFYETALRNKTYRHCIMIPLFNEPLSHLNTFMQPEFQNHLWILIINHPETLSPQSPEVKQNILWLDSFQSQHQAYSLHSISSTSDILIVNRSTIAPLPKKQGVGLARKIGSDIATLLYEKKCLQSPFLLSTDADASLPLDYLKQVQEIDLSYSLAIFNFRHEIPKQHLSSILIYETFLRYYLYGLSFAKSPYAYSTLGSLFYISIPHYAMARGFPKRAAGEDFYLMNKLAKIGKVHQLQGHPIILSNRLSSRTPFGTGQALQKINETLDFLTYPFECFKILKDTLKLLESGEKPTSPFLEKILHQLNIQQQYKHQAKHPQTAKISHWFDALKTLRFIHLLCEQRYPKTSLKNCLSSIITRQPHENDFDYFTRANQFLIRSSLTSRLSWEDPQL